MAKGNKFDLEKFQKTAKNVLNKTILIGGIGAMTLAGCKQPTDNGTKKTVCECPNGTVHPIGEACCTESNCTCIKLPVMNVVYLGNKEIILEDRTGLVDETEIQAGLDWILSEDAPMFTFVNDLVIYIQSRTSPITMVVDADISGVVLDSLDKGKFFVSITCVKDKSVTIAGSNIEYGLDLVKEANAIAKGENAKVTDTLLYLTLHWARSRPGNAKAPCCFRNTGPKFHA
jgi:hypothetical protein